MLSEYNRLEIKIKQLEGRIKNLPPGKFICSRNGKNYKWYVNDNHNKIYIPKKNRQFAEQLALKKYLESILLDLIKEKRAIGFYLKHHSEYKQSESLLHNPEFKNLLITNFQPVSEELYDWANCNYERNPHHPEHLNQKCCSGNLVRSKTESIIDMFLSNNKIPFRYECSLQLGEVTLYPDFTIRHPVTGEVYYWEHFGLMDNSTYAGNVYTKLALYTAHGIIPSINLITTYETKEKPISVGMIEKIVEYYFL